MVKLLFMYSSDSSIAFSKYSSVKFCSILLKIIILALDVLASEKSMRAYTSSGNSHIGLSLCASTCAYFRTCSTLCVLTLYGNNVTALDMYLQPIYFEHIYRLYLHKTNLFCAQLFPYQV